MNKADGILIVGGYGHVGQRIAARLGGRVRIAGRDGGRARDMAARLGCDWAAMDLADPASWPAAMDGMGSAVVCMDHTDAGFARFVLGRGLRYIDISATDAVLARIEALDPLARESGGGAVLSVGLAPGLTNLLAKAASEGMDRTDAVRIGVLLGMGDAHGAAAIAWTLDTLRPLRAGDIRPVGFGQPPRAMLTIPFDFADQHVLMRRGIPHAETRLALDSPLMGRAVLRLMPRLAGSPLFRRVLLWIMARVRLGSDRTALAVEVDGMRDGRPVTRRLTLEGRREADITAMVAAEVAKMLRDAPCTGVAHLDDLWSLDDFADALAREGVRLA